MTRLHPATVPLLLAGLLILLLAAALSALFDEPERMRSWGYANGRHTPIQDCPPTVRPSIPQGDGVAGAIDDWRERRWA